MGGSGSASPWSDTNAYYAAEVQSVPRPEIRSHVLCKPGRITIGAPSPDIEFLAVNSPLRARRSNFARDFRRLKAMHIKSMWDNFQILSPQPSGPVSGVFFPGWRESRHFRGLGRCASVSGLQFLAFRSFGGGFRAPVSARYFPISVLA